MSSIFESDRRAHDRARAEKAKSGASACAVATGLLGCKLLDGGGAATDWALVTCPHPNRTCGASQKETPHMRVSKAGPAWVCACQQHGDSLNLVREVLGLNFTEAVNRLEKFVASANDPKSGDLFGSAS
jgi:CHC2 zinc finger